MLYIKRLLFHQWTLYVAEKGTPRPTTNVDMYDYKKLVRV